MLLGQIGDKYGARKTFGICLVMAGVSMVNFIFLFNMTHHLFLLILSFVFEADIWCMELV